MRQSNWPYEDTRCASRETEAYQIPQPRTPELSIRKFIHGRYLEMRAMDHVQLNRITRRTLPMHHQLLLQMVAIVVILPSVDVPRAELVAVHPIVILVADPGSEVVLRNESTIIPLPGLVLHLGRASDVRQRGQWCVFEIGPSIGEGCVVESPESAEFAQRRKIVVHEVLVRARKIVEDDPVEVAFVRGEFDVEVVFRLVVDGCRCPF